MYFFSIFGPRVVSEETDNHPSQFMDLFRNIFNNNVFHTPTQQSSGLPLSQISEKTTLEIFYPDPSEMIEEGKPSEMQCSICHCMIESGQIIRKINNCNHIFHHQCIDTWFLNHSSCPLCRAPLSSSSRETDSNIEEFTIPISFTF